MSLIFLIIVVILFLLWITAENFIDIYDVEENLLLGPQKIDLATESYGYVANHLDVHSLKNLPKKNGKISYAVFRRQNKDYCDITPTDMQEITQYTGFQNQSRMNRVL